MEKLKRGNVVWVNLDPTIGAEIKKKRPCLIVSLDILNENRSTVVIVPLASSDTSRPPLVIATPTLGKTSNARIDQLRAVDKTRVGNCIGSLSSPEMHEVEQAIRVVLGL